MTERARQVLADCKFAWSKLEDCSAEQEFRILWIAAVALVRLVGDALEKVDSKSDNSLDSAIKEAFQSRQKDAPIYRKFIKFERDQLVHRYESSVYEGDTVILGFEIDGAIEMVPVDDCLHKPLENGPYAGEDARDVLKEAIDWWEHELDWIDNRATDLRGE